MEGLGRACPKPILTKAVLFPAWDFYGKMSFPLVFFRISLRRPSSILQGFLSVFVTGPTGGFERYEVSNCLGCRVTDLGFQAGPGSGYSFQGERGAQSSRDRHSVQGLAGIS